MSRLSDLNDTAIASDDRQDWLRLWQAIAGTRLVVPVADPNATEIRPVLTTVAGAPAVVAYERMETFAAVLAEPGAYAEIDGADLAQMLAGQEYGLAITVEKDAAPLFITEEVLAWIARTYRARIDETEAQGVWVSAPELPEPETVEVLGQTVAALGEDCPEAWLVAMTAAGGVAESVLILGLSDRVARMEAEIAASVTRAVQTGISRPVAVACVPRGSSLMHQARQCGIGIG